MGCGFQVFLIVLIIFVLGVGLGILIYNLWRLRRQPQVQPVPVVSSPPPVAAPGPVAPEEPIPDQSQDVIVEEQEEPVPVNPFCGNGLGPRKKCTKWARAPCDPKPPCPQVECQNLCPNGYVQAPSQVFFKDCQGFWHPLIPDCRDEVVDVCGYSDTLLLLLVGGDILKRSAKGCVERITSNIVMSQLQSFGGYLYALGSTVDCPTEMQLYRLDPDTYYRRTWIWEKACWAPDGIIYATTTLGNDGLWLQTKHEGFFFTMSKHSSKPHKKSCAKYPCDFRRIYGSDCNTYCDWIFQQGKVLFPNGEEVINVKGAALDPKGTLLTLPEGYIRMRYINWECYYISKPQCIPAPVEVVTEELI